MNQIKKNRTELITLTFSVQLVACRQLLNGWLQEKEGEKGACGQAGGRPWSGRGSQCHSFKPYTASFSSKGVLDTNDGLPLYNKYLKNVFKNYYY